MSSNSEMGIVQESYPFSGISSNDHPLKTQACTIVEGYNPVSTTGLLVAKNVNGEVKLSPDGLGVNLDDGKCNNSCRYKMCIYVTI